MVKDKVIQYSAISVAIVIGLTFIGILGINAYEDHVRPTYKDHYPKMVRCKIVWDTIVETGGCNYKYDCHFKTKRGRKGMVYRPYEGQEIGFQVCK